MAGSALPDKTVGGLGPPVLGAAPERAWRALWAIDRNAWLLAAAQSGRGRLALVAAFAALAWVAGLSLSYVAVAAAFAYLPAYRQPIALTAGLIGAVRSTDALLLMLAPVLAQEALSRPLAKALVLAALAVYLAGALTALIAARRQPGRWWVRRPVLSQLGLAAGLTVLAASPLLHGWPRLAVWALLCLVSAYLWFLAYAVQDQRSRAPGPLGLQLGILHPFWRSSTLSLAPTPLGKGAAFLRKHQAKDAGALAVTQLKALKLLVWALLLSALDKTLAAVFEQGLGVPRTPAMYEAFMQGQRLPVLMCWASLVSGALANGLGLAIWGHQAIAVARLAGFALPRNTWRPMEARTLAEFWNRYYFYFKELLVEFFFFPTFLRTFRKQPRLRVFFATFMAAGVGNAIYHALRDVHVVASLGWQQAGISYASYLFYCVVLATGIGVSQARLTAGRQLSNSAGARVWSLLCVWGFAVALPVFGDESRSFPFTDRLVFFLRLFGVN